MDPIIPILATFLGGLLGFLASTYTNRQNNEFQKEHEQIVFQRLEREKLYYVVAKLDQHYRNIQGDCLLKVSNHITPELRDIKGVNGINLWDELSMITNLYFPSMKVSVKNLIDEKDNVGSVLSEVITFNLPQSTKSIQDLNAKIFTSFRAFEKKIEKLQSQISDININLE